MKSENQDLPGTEPYGAYAERRRREAYALEAQEQAEATWKQEIAVEEDSRQNALYEDAKQSLERIINALHDKTRNPAGQSKQSSPPSKWSWSLNKATLHVDRPSKVDIHSGSSACIDASRDGLLQREFRKLDIYAANITPVDAPEVTAYSKITVHVPFNRRHTGYEGRSHSLWYCAPSKTENFRWYEIAFYFSAMFQPIHPFALEPTSEELHRTQVAWPLAPIDKEDEEEFIKYWDHWFINAAHGELYPPTSLPEGRGYLSGHGPKPY